MDALEVEKLRDDLEDSFANKAWQNLFHLEFRKLLAIPNLKQSSNLETCSVKQQKQVKQSMFLDKHVL